MKFTYSASTDSGRVVKGTRHAESKKDLGREMSAEGLLLMSAEPQRLTLKDRLTAINFGGISVIEKVMFARHLSIMIKAGIPLVESLQISVDQTSNKSLKIILGDILESVRNGNSLAKSLDKQRRTFGGLFINMVKVGESSGTLDKNLEYLSKQLEKDYEIRQAVKSAMLYPAVILIAAILLGAALSVFVLPKLVDLFQGLNVELPIITKIFLSIASFISDWIIWILCFIILVIIMLRVFIRIPAIQKTFHRALITLPFIKELTRRVAITRFTRTLGTLLQSGLPIFESLSITKDTVENRIYQDVISDLITRVEKGKLLGSGLAENEKYFPKVVSRMITVGEKTGKLGDTLGYLTEFYEGEIDNTTKNLTTVIEPILLIVIGLIVGGLGIAIITPIYQLSGAIGR